MQDMIVDLINRLQEDLEIAYREFLDNKISGDEYVQASSVINTSVNAAVSLLPNAEAINDSCKSDIESASVKAMQEGHMEMFDILIDAIAKTER